MNVEEAEKKKKQIRKSNACEIMTYCFTSQCLNVFAKSIVEDTLVPRDLQAY